MKNIVFCENAKKLKKIQKFITPKLMIVETSGWRHLKEENKLFLSYEYQNKAGYTANTSCGRVGRGGNARFNTFQLDHHGPTNQRTNGRTDGRTDGRTKPLIESLVRD